VKDKLADGWKWGPVKDADAKTHPDMVAFEKLPFHAQADTPVREASSSDGLV